MSITLLTDLNIIRHSTLKKSLKIFKASTSLFPFKHDHNTQLISKCIEYVITYVIIFVFIKIIIKKLMISFFKAIVPRL